MLLSMVVYLQLMRDEIPVWSTHASASLIVWLFVVSIIVIGIALIQTTLSMSMYLISGQIFKLFIMINYHYIFIIAISMFKILIFYQDDEVENYGPIRGTITFYFAKILNFLSCGLYIYEIPVAVQSIRFGKITQVWNFN